MAKGVTASCDVGREGCGTILFGTAMWDNNVETTMWDGIREFDFISEL